MILDATCACGSVLKLSGGDNKYPYAQEAKIKELFLEWLAMHNSCHVVVEEH
jgi:hypothetical protein